jgi:hypothetical protein
VQLARDREPDDSGSDHGDLETPVSQLLLQRFEAARLAIEPAMPQPAPALDEAA